MMMHTSKFSLLVATVFMAFVASVASGAKADDSPVKLAPRQEAAYGRLKAFVNETKGALSVIVGLPHEGAAKGSGTPVSTVLDSEKSPYREAWIYGHDVGTYYWIRPGKVWPLGLYTGLQAESPGSDWELQSKMARLVGAFPNKHRLYFYGDDRNDFSFAKRKGDHVLLSKFSNGQHLSNIAFSREGKVLGGRRVGRTLALHDLEVNTIDSLDAATRSWNRQRYSVTSLSPVTDDQEYAIAIIDKKGMKVGRFSDEQDGVSWDEKQVRPGETEFLPWADEAMKSFANKVRQDQALLENEHKKELAQRLKGGPETQLEMLTRLGRLLAGFPPSVEGELSSVVGLHHSESEIIKNYGLSNRNSEPTILFNAANTRFKGQLLDNGAPTKIRPFANLTDVASAMTDVLALVDKGKVDLSFEATEIPYLEGFTRFQGHRHNDKVEVEAMANDVGPNGIYRNRAFTFSVLDKDKRSVFQGGSEVFSSLKDFDINVSFDVSAEDRRTWKETSIVSKELDPANPSVPPPFVAMRRAAEILINKRGLYYAAGSADPQQFVRLLSYEQLAKHAPKILTDFMRRKRPTKPEGMAKLGKRGAR